MKNLVFVIHEIYWLFVNSWGKKSKRNNMAMSKCMGKASRSVAEWRFSHARGRLGGRIDAIKLLFERQTVFCF